MIAFKTMFRTTDSRSFDYIEIDGNKLEYANISRFDGGNYAYWTAASDPDTTAVQTILDQIGTTVNFTLHETQVVSSDGVIASLSGPGDFVGYNSTALWGGSFGTKISGMVLSSGEEVNALYSYKSIFSAGLMPYIYLGLTTSGDVNNKATYCDVIDSIELNGVVLTCDSADGVSGSALYWDNTVAAQVLRDSLGGNVNIKINEK